MKHLLLTMLFCVIAEASFLNAAPVIDSQACSTKHSYVVYGNVVYVLNRGLQLPNVSLHTYEVQLSFTSDPAKPWTTVFKLPPFVHEDDDLDEALLPPLYNEKLGFFMFSDTSYLTNTSWVYHLKDGVSWSVDKMSVNCNCKWQPYGIDTVSTATFVNDNGVGVLAAISDYLYSAPDNVQTLLLLSEDGMTWQSFRPSVSVGAGKYFHASGAVALSNQYVMLGYEVDATSYDNQHGVLLFTQDGISWKMQNLSLVLGKLFQFDPNSVVVTKYFASVTDSNQLLVWGDVFNGNEYFFILSFDGNRWSILSSQPDQPYDDTSIYQSSNMACLSKTCLSYWANGGYPGQFLWSFDGAQHWVANVTEHFVPADNTVLTGGYFWTVNWWRQTLEYSSDAVTWKDAAPCA